MSESKPLLYENPSLHAPAKLTRTFFKRLSGLPQVNYAEQLGWSNALERSCHTAISINQLPEIFERIVAALQLRDNQHCYQEGKIQHFLIEQARDKVRYPRDASERLCNDVLSKINTDPQQFTIMKPNWDRIRPVLETVGPSLAEMVERYNSLTNTEQERKKRSFRNDSPLKYQWNPEDIQRFNEAFKTLGNSPRSNRQIAALIGNGVHPNHVAYFKMQMRKKQKQS